MGVHGIFISRNTKIFDQALDRLESFARETAQWNVSITALPMLSMRARGVDHHLYCFEYQDASNDGYTLTGCALKNDFVVGDPQVLQYVYQHRANPEGKGRGRNPIKITITGKSIRYGDFIIRKGTLQSQSAPRTPIVDVEYLPCDAIGQCEQLLNEFVSSVVGGDFFFPFHAPNYADSKLGNIYSEAHLISDYIHTLRSYEALGLVTKDS
eukprot:TRINITY_DN7070_c0_g1_i4.p1 TRINITY_DN7070_c0_g1~~TRINITY_DN7070_c0_g1_i4.p1  ORF type:complete len:211 (+),score=28.18 TRINITY_DN7070_c0_g1_i4:86-718(+)